MDAGVAILIPVLRRPHRVEPLLEAFAATTTDYSAVFIATEDDQAEQDAVTAFGGTLLVLPGQRKRGDYARKINLAYRETTEPILFTAADDLVPHPGWYETASALFSDTIQVVGTNDLGNGRVTAGHHSTHTLVTRKYVDERGTIDRPGEVLCEQYNHWYVDDEFIQTAQARGTFAPCLDSHVEHFHPAWKKNEYDPTYVLGESERHRDRKVYDRRLARIRAG